MKVTLILHSEAKPTFFILHSLPLDSRPLTLDQTKKT